MDFEPAHYSTILWEIDDELVRLGAPDPDLVAVQIGVGALAAAVARHYLRPGVAPRLRLIGVEPADAACLLASVAAGLPTAVPGPHPSPVAWPPVSGGLDLFVAIDDEWAREAMRSLAAIGIVAGETGAAGLAGLLALRRDPELSAARIEARLTSATRVLILNTEGATDHDAYDRVVNERPSSSGETGATSGFGE